MRGRQLKQISNPEVKPWVLGKGLHVKKKKNNCIFMSLPVRQLHQERKMQGPKWEVLFSDVWPAQKVPVGGLHSSVSHTTVTTWQCYQPDPQTPLVWHLMGNLKILHCAIVCQCRNLQTCLGGWLASLSGL